MGKTTFELDWYIIFLSFPLPSHSCLQMFEDWSLFLLCSVGDENYRVESMCLIHLYSCQSFTTPRLSISHSHSLITKERGRRKWCHKDVMEPVYRIVLCLSIPVSHELPELLCQWHVTPPWAGFDRLIVQHLMLLLHFYWPSTFIFRNLFLCLGLSM